MSRSDGQTAIGRLGFVSAAIVLLTALALVLSIRAYQGLLEESFRERSVAYAQAFAASASTWLDPPDIPMLRTASQFMLVGSAAYVQVALGEETLIDVRADRALELHLDVPESVGPLARSARSPSIGSYLDIVSPLPETPEASAPGYVRLGIDASSVRVRGRNTALAAGALAIAIDVLLILLVRWAMRPHRMAKGTSQVGESAGTSSRTGGPIVVGELTIDPMSKMVRLGADVVPLTPKQYALLVLLAREPGRVFSEREIVDEVWADSAYADSKDVKQYVYLVRQRLAKADPSGRNLVVTVPGFGYKLATDAVDGPLTGR